MASKILFKDGKIQFSNTGKILFTPAAGDASDCACCDSCPDDGTSCGFCTSTSARRTVTFAGVSLCGTCINVDGGANARVRWNAGDVLNTSHVLVQQLDSCVWMKTLTNAIVIEESLDTACGTASFVADLTILLRKATTDISFIEVYSEQTLFSGLDVSLFADRLTTAAQDCSSVVNHVNNLSTCGISPLAAPGFGATGDAAMGTGGTAEVICGPAL